MCKLIINFINWTDIIVSFKLLFSNSKYFRTRWMCKLRNKVGGPKTMEEKFNLTNVEIVFRYSEMIDVH